MTRPMLLKKFENDSSKIVYPAFIQAKLDGIYCKATKVGNETTLTFRSGRVCKSVPHINAAFNELLSSGDEVDSELYREGVDFDKISGDIRSEDGRDNRYLHALIFDHPVVLGDAKYQQHERIAQLEQYHDNGQIKEPLVLINTYIVESEEDAYRGLDYYLSEGLEGAVVRNTDGTYLPTNESGTKRSFDAQKLKPFTDDEFKIIDMVEGKGKWAGCVGKFKCEVLVDGKIKTFTSTAGGTKEHIQGLFNEWPKSKGQMLTVRYMELTKSGVPRQGRGRGVRYDL